MIDFSQTRHRLIAGALGLWAVGVAAIIAAPVAPEEAVVVTHWANGHPMDADLLPAFAQRFNLARHRTQSGRVIEVRPVTVNSGTITEGLIGRLKPGAPSEVCKATGCVPHGELHEPIIVTPVVDHWLSQVNYAVGEAVIDLENTRNLMTTYVGIVTLREIAQCLGWPEKPVGFEDVVALRNDPRGWKACPNAQPSWGERPLIAFTDPSSSSTGRSMLLTLYSLAAGKPPGEVTLADVRNPAVVE